MKTDYEVAMEIAGPLAMWSRPDTGSAPTSYPIPTWSAAKGIFESIAFFSNGSAWIRPIKVEICRPLGTEGLGEIPYQKYTTNYGGPLRDSASRKKGNNFQLSAIVAANVCYRLHGVVENSSGRKMRRGDNPCHQLQAIFLRRLAKGQCYKTPCLGWNEFTPDYWGPIREAITERDTSIYMSLNSFMHSVFDEPLHGQYQPRFVHGQSSVIKKGKLKYAE